jgi:hypothetical protein
VNDQPVITVTDDRWKRGQVGLRTYATDKDRAASAFDNVHVQPAVIVRGR